MSSQASEVNSSATANFEASPHRLELPDPSVSVDSEFAAVWSTAEVIGALSADDYRWSFTSVLLALLYSEQETSRWFLTYAQSANINLSAVCGNRGFHPEQLAEMRRQFAAGGSFLRKTAFTGSIKSLFEGALDLYRLVGGQSSGPLGARHLIAAYIYRLPSGHLDQLTQWGFVPAHWSENFVKFESVRVPTESFWATLHQQQFGTPLTTNQPPSAPGVEGFRFQLTSPQGPAEFAVSAAAYQLLNYANLHKKKGLLVSEMLVFAAIETGRADSGNLVLSLLSNALASSKDGLSQYETIAFPHLDRQTSTVTSSPPVRCTKNFLTVLREAQRIASIVTNPGLQNQIDLRHLMAALLLTKTVATSIMTRLGLDIDSLKSQLYTTVSSTPDVSDNINTWSDVLFAPVQSSRVDPASEFVPLRADFTADNIPADPSASDRLGFRRDVRAFASVIAARDLSPPMSIGIFGDWGSGKTFFMKQLEQKVVSMAGKGEEYCSHIVPIWFNAWHYVDQNLWATLVTEIFDKLFAFIRAEKEEDANARIKAIEDELSKQQGLHTEAGAELVKAKAEREIAENELKQLRKTRKEKENSLSAQLNDIAQLVAGNSEVKAKLEEIDRDLGLPALQSSYETFEAQVEQMQSLGNRAIAVLASAFREPGWIRRVGYLLVIFGLPAAVVALLAKLSPEVRTPAQVIAGLATFFTLSALWMRGVYMAGSAVVAKAETALTELRRIRESRSAQQEAEGIGEIEVLRERENAARQKIKDTESKVQELQQEVKELQPGRRLQRFIEQRFAAGDYRQHLGLISLIRRDFETLSRLLRERKDLPVDRIVLFIDDLDRCPPDRVGEVLEAIHLILAFELFVVVVGVDVRWVARALQKRYAGLLTSTITGLGPTRDDLASPDDYLEKIFQIPFWINPLLGETSRDLVSGMLEKYRMAPPPTTDLPPLTRPETATESKTDSLVNSGSTATVPPPTGEQILPANAQVPPVSEHTALDRANGGFPPSDEEKSMPIVLTKGELDYMLELSNYGGRSPRRLKRFINIYRIIKSTVSEKESVDFLVGSGEKGDYRLVLALLAVLTGSPSISAELFRKMKQPQASLVALIEELNKGDGTESRNCFDALNRFRSDHPDGPTSTTLNRWASVVARYNFQPQ